MKPLVFPGPDSAIVPPGQISALGALSQSRSRFPPDAEADPRPNPPWLYIVLILRERIAERPGSASNVLT